MEASSDVVSSIQIKSEITNSPNSSTETSYLARTITLLNKRPRGEGFNAEKFEILLQYIPHALKEIESSDEKLNLLGRITLLINDNSQIDQIRRVFQNEMEPFIIQEIEEYEIHSLEFKQKKAIQAVNELSEILNFGKEYPNISEQISAWHEKYKSCLDENVIRSLDLNICFELAGCLGFENLDKPTGFLSANTVDLLNELSLLLPKKAKDLFDQLIFISNWHTTPNRYSLNDPLIEMANWKRFINKFKNEGDFIRILAELINSKFIDVRYLLYYSLISFEQLEELSPWIKSINLDMSYSKTISQSFVRQILKNTHYKKFIQSLKNIRKLRFESDIIPFQNINFLRSLNWENLKVLEIRSEHINILHNNLINLRVLKLHKCYNLKELPINLHNLRVLNLQSCPNLEVLPENLEELKYLKLEFCDKINKIDLNKFPRIKVIDLYRIENLPIFTKSDSVYLNKIELNFIKNIEKNLDKLPPAEKLIINHCPIEDISNIINYKELKIWVSNKFTKLPKNSFLEMVDLYRSNATNQDNIDFISNNNRIHTFISNRKSVMSDTEFEQFCEVVIAHPRLTHFLCVFTQDQYTNLIDRVIKSKNRTLVQIINGNDDVLHQNEQRKESERNKIAYLEKRKVSERNKIAYAVKKQLSPNPSSISDYKTADFLLYHTLRYRMNSLSNQAENS